MKAGSLLALAFVTFNVFASSIQEGQDYVVVRCGATPAADPVKAAADINVDMMRGEVRAYVGGSAWTFKIKQVLNIQILNQGEAFTGCATFKGTLVDTK